MFVARDVVQGDDRVGGPLPALDDVHVDGALAAGLAHHVLVEDRNDDPDDEVLDPGHHLPQVGGDEAPRDVEVGLGLALGEEQVHELLVDVELPLEGLFYGVPYVQVD